MINYIFLTSMFFNFSFCENLYYNLTKSIPTEENIQVCSQIIDDAKSLSVPLEIALSVAWEESNFTIQLEPTPSKCVGPMQIKIRYWCTGKKLKTCDIFYDGVKALKYYLKRFKPMNKAICYYNDSKKCSKKNKYESNYVKRFKRSLRKTKRLMRSSFYKEAFKN